MFIFAGQKTKPSSRMQEQKGEILIYQNQQGSIKIDVRLDDETVWLTQNQLCELFQKSKATISEHIKNVFEEGELEATATVRNFRTVQIEGNREVERAIEYYNLDVIISVGTATNSHVYARLDSPTRQLTTTQRT